MVNPTLDISGKKIHILDVGKRFLSAEEIGLRVSFVVIAKAMSTYANW